MLPGMNDIKYCPVTLEPELEEIAALWPAAKRFEMAEKFRRWAWQLKVSARVMVRNSACRNCPKPALRFVAPRKAALN